MNNTQGKVKVTYGRSVLHGRFDYPVEVREDRSLLSGDITEGYIDFFLEHGPIITFGWDSRRGAHVDKIESDEETE